MKMDLFRTALLLLASVVAVAQQDQSSQQPSTNPPSSEQTATGVGGATDQNEPVFRGCLSGTDGNYTLNDASSGKTYRLHSDKDINEHVGNLVEVRGTVKKEGEDRSQTATAGQQEIDVADVKTVSRGCESAGAGASADTQSAAATGSEQAASTSDSTQVASAQEGAMADEGATALPQTASPLPLVALLGLVSLAAGFAGLRRR